VPEEIEVDTDDLREKIHEEVEREGGALLRSIALSTAVIAAFAAVAALRAGSTVNEALVLKTEATRAQVEASDQWALFQAKGIKAAVAEASRSAWLAAGKEPPPELAQREAQFAAQKGAIEEKAAEAERMRDEKLAEADHLMHRHHRFANAVALSQVAIALGAVAALTRARSVWLGSLALGVAAVALFVAGWLA
jgi:Domain of unknown function (DUF4337)